MRKFIYENDDLAQGYLLLAVILLFMSSSSLIFGHPGLVVIGALTMSVVIGFVACFTNRFLPALFMLTTITGIIGGMLIAKSFACGLAYFVLAGIPFAMYLKGHEMNGKLLSVAASFWVVYVLTCCICIASNG
ncbi:MAG: hypothetical protein NT135_00800 [Candidatus Berkelbacteria bacterium]|nr:hypothetical protein [Candidatus Berkelbacteria bacterium]